MSKHFKVNDEWLGACGMNVDRPPLKVIKEEQFQQSDGRVVSFLTLDCGTHQWVVDSRRGYFVKDRT